MRCLVTHNSTAIRELFEYIIECFWLWTACEQRVIWLGAVDTYEYLLSDSESGGLVGTRHLTTRQEG